MSKPSYAAVLFDCDSTLSAIEGIDELARQAGLYDELAPLTAAAMDGRLTLEAVYRRRLDAIRPDRAAIEALAQCYIERRVADVDTVMAQLHAAGKQVHIISGGLRQAILPLAAHLGVPADQVHAVDVYFDADGAYRDFDEASPLARSGGKTDVCRHILARIQPAVLIGDGVTDSEAVEAGVDFIGFGGVVQRAAVKQAAAVYIDDASLLPVLSHVLV